MQGTEAAAIEQAAQALRTLGLIGGAAFAIIIIWFIYKIVCAFLAKNKAEPANPHSQHTNGRRTPACAWLETSIVMRDKVNRTEAIVTRTETTMVRVADSNERQEAILNKMLQAMLSQGGQKGSG